ncbi:MAG: putative Ig domain-containing protein [Cyanobacteria bacterium P01_A01_bin.84]
MPGDNDVVDLDIKVTATDPGGETISDNFTLQVTNTNDTPKIDLPIDDQNINQGELFKFKVPIDTFFDVDPQDTLTYSATLDDGSPLPSWLTFNPQTKEFSGTPSDRDTGIFNIKVIATDTSGETISDTFSISVKTPVIGSTANELLIGSNINENIDGKGGKDFIIGKRGSDDITGGDDVDIIFGDVLHQQARFNSPMDDNIRSGGGDDIIFGGVGIDHIYGEAGNDFIRGEDGDDHITGGLGNDMIYGGAGKDMFHIYIGNGIDTISDFHLTQDVIALSGGLTFPDISWEQSNTDTSVVYNQTQEVLALLKGINATDLTQSSFITSGGTHTHG